VDSLRRRNREARINSSPLNVHWTRILVDLEKAARLMVSRVLNVVWKELFIFGILLHFYQYAFQHCLLLFSLEIFLIPLVYLWGYS
jgi:hypothetical protein